MEQTLRVLSAGLSPLEWHLLGAIAAEERLGATALAAIAKAADLSCEGAQLTSFLERGVAGGLLVNAGEVRSVSLRFAGLHEPSWALSPGLRQLTLRTAEARGSLLESTRASAAVLGQRSQGRFVYRLQSGALRLQPEGDRALSLGFERHLRESVCESFDAYWFERTWAAQTFAVALRVLRHALPELEACTDLYVWTVSRADGEHNIPGLTEVLAQHALLREKWEQAEALASELPAGERFALSSAAKAMQGDVEAAQYLLDQSLAFSAKQLPRAGALTPLLMLLLLERDTDLATAVAKKWLSGRPSAPELKGPSRAFRTLLRHRDEPESSLKRIDAYQQPPGTTAWEYLLQGLVVHAYAPQAVTRSAWSRLLLHKAQEWSTGDYDWPAQQARLIARGLDPEFTEKTRLGGTPRLEPRRSLALTELVVARAPWELSLRALDKLSTVADLQPEAPLRLEWFVNMLDGSISRPGLQEFRSGEGWSAARRVSLDEAFAQRTQLPPEDRLVLECSELDAEGSRRLLPEAHEALIGHERVVNGARGDLPIDVVRGCCRVETQQDGEFLKILVTPPGLSPGVNVRAESESRLSVVRLTPVMEKVLQIVPDELRVPQRHAERALALLGKLGDVFSPEAGTERLTSADATPCLRILPVAGAWCVQAGVRPFGVAGRFFVAGTGTRTLSARVRGAKLRTRRDFAEETRRLAEFVGACPTLSVSFSNDAVARAPGESKESWVFSADELLSVLAEIRDCGLPCAFEWPESAPLSVRGMLTTGSLHGNLRAQKGWYLVSGSVRLDDVTALSLAELVALPTVARGRFARLPTGDFLEIEGRVRRLVALLGRGTTTRTGELRLHQSSVHALRVLRETPEFEVDERAQQLLADFDAQRAADFQVPAQLGTELRGYQREGFRWLSSLGELGLGACLADDMGLGKTVQILAFLLTRPANEPILIVAPTSVCTNWLRELARFAPSLSAAEYVGNKRAQLLADPAGRVIICSYALLHEDITQLAAVPWNTVVLDEAQFIKNPQSQRAQAAFSLQAKHRIAATGTPVENHLGDLWSIFHFLQPELLGSWKSFNLSFVKPIERDGDHGAREALRAIVQPYVLRRLKSQVLTELPPLTTVRHELVFTRDEALRYALLRRQIHARLRTVAGKRQNKLEVLAEITRLRRFCCHPKLVFPDAPNESSKIDAFLDLVGELGENGHRALVFSQYVDFLALLREHLDELGMPYEYLDGSTPKPRRQEAVDTFQTGGAPLFLISLKAGGLGLNLTAADYVIHLDPWWNPAVEAQATDRAHRIGQRGPVTVYQFVTRDTIEEDILELHKSKRGLADALLEGAEHAGALSTAELLAWIERAQATDEPPTVQTL